MEQLPQMDSASVRRLTDDCPIVLLGAGGMLYRAWAELLASVGQPFVGLSPADIELTDPASIDAAVRPQWRLVINCAAYTDVDGAETHPALAMAVNGTGVGRLAERCRQVGAMLVHYSTDYVFRGNATRPYRIDDPPEPVGVYAQSKALGERLVRQSGCRALIIRTSWLYAPWGRNFVRTIAGLARQKPTLSVVNDQTGRPTSAEHLAATSLRLLAAGHSGIRHVTDGGQCTWFDLAAEVARAVNPACQVLPCTTAEFPRPAPRPAYSVLDLSDTECVLGPMPPWRENLAKVLPRLEP